jgi:hypothetical protein
MVSNSMIGMASISIVLLLSIDVLQPVPADIRSESTQKAIYEPRLVITRSYTGSKNTRR